MNQAYQVFKDETRTFTFYAREADSTPINLTGATVSLAAPLTLGTFVSLTGTIVDAAKGSYTVTVNPTTSSLLVGMNLPIYSVITLGGVTRIVNIPDGLNVLERAR